MQLKRYKVTNFRSVEDSGWIELDHVAAFIGVNESGKTNLLVPLWKLNPAQEGEIQPTADYPKKLFGTIRQKPKDYWFIQAEFHSKSVAAGIASLTKCDAAKLENFYVWRNFAGDYYVEFYKCPVPRETASATVKATLDSAHKELSGLQPLEGEAALKAQVLQKLPEQAGAFQGDGKCKADQIKPVVEALKKLVPEAPVEGSTIVPHISQLIASLGQEHDRISQKEIGQREDVRKFVFERLPKFVYYSNYGNLDSEIYLPHVVENLERTDLGQKDAAKLFRASDDDFSDVVKAGLPLVPQIETWAATQKITLQPGWKVELAKRVKQSALSKGPKIIPDDHMQRLVKLFKAVLESES